MLSTDLLIDDVVETVQDPSVSRQTILRYLNSGNMDIAGKVLLPDLADGYGTVTTVTNDNNVPVPGTFHRNIYLAQCDNTSVNVFLSLHLMIKKYGRLTKDSGILTGLAVNGRKLFYKSVPFSAKDIELMFYRLPVDMTDDPSSYPDGVTNCQEYEECLLDYACWKIFRKIEDGMEPEQMVNTNEHKAGYLSSLVELKRYCRKVTGPQAEMPLSGADEIFT